VITLPVRLKMADDNAIIQALNALPKPA
jgi:hypothetical protein